MEMSSLVQMHQMPGHPHQLDPLHATGYHNPHHLNSDYLPLHHPIRPPPRLSNLYQNSIDPPLRAYSIRASQPAQQLQRVNASFAQHHTSQSSENSLRRKTPNGTIDNGYDGSHTQLAAGPPPLKHMILPGSRKIFPTANTGHPTSIPGSSWLYSSQSINNSHDSGFEVAQSSNPAHGGWGHGQNHMGQNVPSMMDQAAFMQSGAQGSYNNQGLMMHHGYSNAYQQQAEISNYSPVGFNPSPVWGDGPLAQFHSPLHFQSTGYVPHNAPYESAFNSVQAPLHQGALGGQFYGQNHPFRMPMPAYSLDDGFSRHGPLPSMMQSHQSQDFSQVSSPTGDSSSPARFRERALAQAHKTYAGLLMYLSHTKKIHHSKSSTGTRSPSKMVLFPQPPKQLSARFSPRMQPARHQTFPGPPGSFSSHHGQGSMNAPSSMNMMIDANGRQINGHPAVMAEIFGNPAVHKYSYMGKSLQRQPFNYAIGTAIGNAKASLEMLSNLCEQSGWEWIDGMLLGGCLQYGLEHYEEALEWFKRIINIDSSHVEAISNIAATLYCLNRQEEAEQHWLQAIKIRPSYLEAVEHLVGLLCSNHRSREAVDAIDFVQRSLRTKPQDLHGENRIKKGIGTDASSSANDIHDKELTEAAQAVLDLSVSGYDKGQQDGFGSSGYDIAGSDNGRMLLLVHAKGNMLYALKQTERASGAFEEAVLISAGRNIGGVQNLIRKIQTVLSPRNYGEPPPDQKMLSAPLLLPPERAKFTAELVFASGGGHLPGLRYVPDNSHKKSAISTTSNSLLSLAKIFQDAMSAGGSSAGLRTQPSGVGDILALYYLSLSLQESPSTANNVGILLASVQQSSQSVSVPETSYAPNIPGIVPGSGLSLALAYYQYGLSLDPKHVHLHTNLGSLLKDIGQLDHAIIMYRKAVECDGSFDIALTNLANAVKDRGRIDEAIEYYRRAVNSNPEFAEAVCGLSTALNSICDWRGRGGVVLNGGKFDRWHVDKDGMLRDVQQETQGFGLMKKVVDIVGRQLKDASAWGSGLVQGNNTLALLVSQLNNAGAGRTDKSLDLESELRRWAGKPWEGSRLLRLVERSTRAATWNWYQDKYVRGVEAPAGGYPRPRPPGKLSVPSAPTVLPFHTFTCPLTAKDIRKISQRNALRISCSTLRSPWLPSQVYPPPKPPGPFLNIGYVSSDFNNHPLAHLMQSVFGFHDQSRAKAFCYATTASDGSPHRKQIEREAPVFRDVSSWSSDKLVNKIVQDGIHILVNLNGYTRGARNEIFAARPAPIQMSFMGFAGTLGAEWCDYLLADTTAIPPSTLRPHRGNLNLTDVFRDEAQADAEDWVYSENIIFCRDTFFCCDHRQSADSAEQAVTWEDEQLRRWKMRKSIFKDLPDDMIILGNFNQLYKIDPTTFRTWLRILANTPKAILWLLKFPDLGEIQLKRTAVQWAGEEVASRIRFTDVAPKQEHISRARVCDLFLDTPECNAHTTAADILWSSTPLLTLPRYKYKMCSRMAASILKGALPNSPAGEQAAVELIAEDDASYEEAAIKLANSISYRITRGGYGEGSGRLAEIRRLLFDSKWSCALFNTRRWVSDLEDAYEEAWRRYVAGEQGDIYL